MVLAGLNLITPNAASRSEVIRTKGFLSDEEISQVEEAADKVNELNPVPTWDTVYLQNDKYFKLNLASIYAKIQQLVVDVDAKHWGMLPELEKRIGSTDGVNARCVEFHEYGKHARRTCGEHIDSGSLFTVDIMLSSTSDFEGGEFTVDSTPAAVTPVAREEEQSSSLTLSSSSSDPDTTTTATVPGAAAPCTKHNKLVAFERGDAIVFVSHKRHSVTPVTSGTRCVLVLEFWEGSECKGQHRCMNPCCGWDYDEDNNFF